MEELSIEEKAKRYDEAIERAKKVLLDCTIDARNAVEFLHPELKESEDERIRKAIIEYLKMRGPGSFAGYPMPTVLAWLEKPGEHADFRNKIQIGDKVTRNKDGVLVNLSQLKRVANKDENQGEQKPAWSEEDEDTIEKAICVLEANFEPSEEFSELDIKRYQLVDRLKSIKDRYTWKPSEEMLEALYKVIPQNVMAISEDEILLDKLYQGLKYGRVLSKN